MQIILNLRKTLEQSANESFEKAKKLRKKAAGAHEIIKKFQKQLEELERKQQLEEQRATPKKERRTPEWYEKFRWFVSSEGFLCIGGRDATTNEIVIKKHTDANDIVFHTEMPGSPFFVIKTEGKKPGPATLQEVADATVTFSRAWKLGMTAAEVFSVTPNQLSKKAQSGEYLTKGAFIITGKKTSYQGNITIAVCKLEDGKIMAGPENAAKAHSKTTIKLQPGKDKPSDCAKTIAKKLNADVDDVLRVLPGGTCSVPKQT
ncbi:DUF814 domain-containing protein [Candidatus Woesearchaeota archaeon]|nr:DUF814 domain-containing protein [Candidatus Woesearchaeota archaeon]